MGLRPLPGKHRLTSHGLQRAFNECRFISRRCDDNVFEALRHAYCDSAIDDLLERGTGIVQSLRVVPGASLSILPPHEPIWLGQSHLHRHSSPVEHPDLTEMTPNYYLDSTGFSKNRRLSSSTRFCCCGVSCGNIGNDRISAVTLSVTGKSPGL